MIRRSIQRRDPAEPPRYPEWLRTLSYPPWRVHLDEDIWPLIEHIRQTGQMGSGAVYYDQHSPYDLPWEGEGPPPLDKNAPERLQALQESELRKRASDEWKRFYNSPDQVRKRFETRKKREAERLQLAKQRLELEAEHKRIIEERAAEQARRDAEWEQAASKAAEHKAADVIRAHHEIMQKFYATTGLTPPVGINKERSP